MSGGIPGKSDLVLDAFQYFLDASRGDLRRIAARTRGEMSVEDLSSESWLIGIEIGRKRGWPIDFRDLDDQHTLLAWLHNRFVKYAEKTFRHASRLDQDRSHEDSEHIGSALARVLTAPLETDPAMRRRAQDEMSEFADVVRRSYSEASAYVVLLMRVDWDAADLAAMLWIGVDTLRKRLRASGLLVRIQPSLFDGINEIDADFLPWRRCRHGKQRAGQGGPTRQIVLSLQ